MKFTDEQIRHLADAERMMDSGESGFVRLGGGRLMASPEVMKHFGLKQGQTITDTIFCAILEFNIARICEDIAGKATDDVLQRAQEAAAKDRPNKS